jgi:hypothetical protein
MPQAFESTLSETARVERSAAWGSGGGDGGLQAAMHVAAEQPEAALVAHLDEAPRRLVG